MDTKTRQGNPRDTGWQDAGEQAIDRSSKAGTTPPPRSAEPPLGAEEHARRYADDPRHSGRKEAARRTGQKYQGFN